MEKRVVITGLGIVAPNAVGLEHYTEALKTGKSGIRRNEELVEKGFGCQIAGVPDLSTVNVESYLSELTLRFLKNDAIIYSCIAGLDAWKDAGLERPSKDEIDWDSGIIFGAGSLCADHNLPIQVDMINKKMVRKIGSKAVEQRMNNGATVYLSGMLGLGNWVASNSAACSTGTESLIMGYDWIKMGRAKRMLCGSTEGQGSFAWAGFDSMRILVRDANDQPEKGSRPLSNNAKGFVPGTGAGALVLEDYDSAIARGAKIYAEILGGANNSGGQRLGGTMVAPNSIGVKRCIKDAITQSQITADEIDLISGHLTSTMADPIEVKNWSEVLNRSGKDFPFINSTKSMIGHGLGSAGSMELVACCLQMEHGFVHPSINVEQLHPGIEAMISRECVPNNAIEKDINIVAKSSFAFGDTNSCAILKKWKDC